MADFIARILLVDEQPASVGLLMAYLEDRDINERNPTRPRPAEGA
jgi:hypothetical protein